MKPWATWFLSAFWSELTKLSRMLIRAGILRPAKLPVRVVSVGNIQVGGAGKTPLVALIARDAQQRGLKVCILTRGYGGSWSKSGGIIEPGSPEPKTEDSGDEAALLHDLCPQAWIGVGADREAQFYRVQEKASQIDLVVLDDGFQNFKIKKDLEIVALTSKRRTEILHRDWPSALTSADLLVWTKGEKEPAHPGKPMVRVRSRLSDTKNENRILFVSGLADGKSAAELLKKHGLLIEKHLLFPDHARYDQSWVSFIMKTASAQGLRVALTGKDWVKWREFGVSRESVEVFEPEIEIEAPGRDVWNRVLWES